MNVKELERKATQLRIDLLQMIYEAGTGHTASSLSHTDILTTLFYSVMKFDPKNPQWPDRDRYIQSKGQAVEAYWVALADLGFFPKEELKTYSRYGSRLIGHPNNKVPGVEMNTGALGHGLSIAAGMALSAKMDRKSFRVFTLMGDGEQAEGSIWEAAMSAAHYKLDNLIGIIDRNRLQITGATEDVMSIEPLDKKWESFGWNVVSVDGNNIAELQSVLTQAPEVPGKPTLVLAKTIKGRGVSFMENEGKWHHKVPSEEELQQAVAELSSKLGVLQS